MLYYFTLLFIKIQTKAKHTPHIILYTEEPHLPISVNNLHLGYQLLYIMKIISEVVLIVRFHWFNRFNPLAALEKS
jgi:hypothetical protein